MPISEDEVDCDRSQETQSTMSKAELRKTHKPIMEKRRRARINQCLNEIKTLILEAMNKDPSRHTKLEKADILEMAVKHLQNVQRQHLALAMATDPSVLRKFKNGFNECATEIDKYIDQVDNVDGAMKHRVSNHLQKCIGGIEQVAQFSFPGFSNIPLMSASNAFTPTSQTLLEAPSIGDQNNNPRIQIPQGIQLIPSRLSSGELALLVPNSSNMPYFSSTVTATIQNRPSAFAAVIPQTLSTDCLVPKPPSPPISPSELEDIRSRNVSPQGFRPVLRKMNEDHQVPQISSTVPAERHYFPRPLEVKPLKFPIHKYSEKDKKSESPKKLAEPLCIITNQSERYKQAQMKEDSANLPENIVQRGTKRRYSEIQGLLSVAHEVTFATPAPKILKTQLGTPAASFVREHESSSTSNKYDNPKSIYVSASDEVRKEQRPSGSSDEKGDSNSDVWRPW